MAILAKTLVIHESEKEEMENLTLNLFLKFFLPKDLQLSLEEQPCM